MPALTTVLAQRVLETALLCAQRPLTVAELRTLFAGELGADTVKDCLLALQQHWAGRGVELVAVASGWRFQSRADMREYLDRLNPEKIPPYKSAELQVLATIAWRQPVTLGDIADIRGVTATSADIIKRFEDRGWIEVVGRRESSGARLFGTTRKFLDDLGLASLQDLPALDELAAPTQPDFEHLALKHPELDWAEMATRAEAEPAPATQELAPEPTTVSTGDIAAAATTAQTLAADVAATQEPTIEATIEPVLQPLAPTAADAASAPIAPAPSASSPIAQPNEQPDAYAPEDDNA